jgi:serine/threonine-protein kinase HipA
MGRRPARAPLNVYLNARLVGQLRRESSGATDFKYDKDWLAWSNAIPVSVSLPLREDRYIGDPVLAVFDNLLPDNDDIRRRVAERSHAGGGRRLQPSRRDRPRLRRRTSIPAPRCGPRHGGGP